MSKSIKIIAGLIGLVVAVPLFTGAALYLEARSSEKPPLLENIPFSHAVYSRNGDVLSITRASDGIFRLQTDRQSLPANIVDATLRYEDRYFYSHPGVNPVSLVKAAWATWLGDRAIGASTITMQLARRLLDMDTRTPAGKWRQIRAALAYEAHYSKDEILAAYLSVVPYGGNIEGIDAAAELYFGKRADELSVNEAIALSVVPQNPVKRNPIGGEDFAKARLRAGEAALASGAVPSRIAPALRAPLLIEKRLIPFEAPHFTRRVSAMEKDLLQIRTGLSLALNRGVETILKDHVEKTRPFGIGNAASMVLDARTMDVVAYVGSADFFNDAIAGEVDGVAAYRSPGSTLKPFIYGLALDQGKIHSRSILMDAPSNYSGYEPLNEDRLFQGPLDATTALNRSRNIPAIMLAQDLKPDLYDFLKGINTPLKHPRDWYGLSIVLGSAEVNMAKLASAYAAFLSKGVFSTPRWTAETPREVRPLFSPQAAAIVRDMLKEGGYEVEINNVRLPLAWKTGTSNGYRDAWTVGFAGPYIIAVWTGNFSGKASERLRGAEVALPLWEKIAMRTLTEPELAVTPEEAAENPVWNALPKGVTKQKVCRSTGDLAFDNFGRIRCTDTLDAYFIPGKSPIAPTGFMKEVRVDPQTGFRTCPGFKGETEVRFFEDWPQKWRNTLEESGVIVMPLPPLHPLCGTVDSVSTEKPVLTEPKERRVFRVDPHTNTVDIRLRALAPRDNPKSRLFWFYQGVWLGNTRSGETLHWATDPGVKRITVTDDAGHAEHRTVTVLR